MNVTGYDTVNYSGAHPDRRIPGLAIQQRMGLWTERVVVTGGVGAAGVVTDWKALVCAIDESSEET